tara:strand:+ start:962 stop:2887 length:1926 start_codon:yes stop_codon:yes gene_type:complete
MCGIAGIINFNNGLSEKKSIEEMTNVISHRGPDDSGFFHDKFVHFGFRRLSIIDIDLGHQPMKSKDERYTIIFNGEIYNYKYVRDELENKGYKFKTNSDTEVIIYSYDFWGKNCMHHFNGMFAFAIYDQMKQEVFLARDRMGIKPLYYTKAGNNFIFSSEIKSILRHPQVDKTPDYMSISSYLTFRYTYGENSFFGNIKKVNPGHCVTINRNEFKSEKYWSIPFHGIKKDLGENYYIEKTQDLLKEAVKRRLISDVPLGALLSGGLDSSLVVSLMSSINKDKINSYSIGFDQIDYDESKYAQIVASYCNTEHLHLNLSKNQYIDNLSNMIERKDAPLSIPHEQALYLICRELKKYTTVVISGEGADELFGGYGRVHRSPMDYKKILFLKRFFPKEIYTKLLSILGLPSSIENINTHQDHFFSVYNWMPIDEKLELFTDQMNQEINFDKNLREFWEQDFKFTSTGNLYDQVLYLFEKNHLICLLDRLDVMSMASGVEARVPFVDHELIEFCSTIPIQYKLKWKSKFHKYKSLFRSSFSVSENNDISKFILRKIGYKHLPKNIVDRKKKGFPVPLDDWLNSGMIDNAKEILLDNKTFSRKIFRKEKLEDLLNNKQNLQYDFWGKKIWMLMNTELWFRKFIDQQ